MSVKVQQARSSLRPHQWFIAIATAIVAVLIASLAAAVPARAATVYELEGEWSADTPETVQTGGAVSSRWWFNLNDDASAPGNGPVEPNVLTVTAVGAVFDELPTACKTTDVDPVSEIIDDGVTLICNVGTQDQGTAITLTSAMRVTATSGEQVSTSAEIGGETVDVEPLTVQNPFVQDIRWEANAGQRVTNDGSRDFEFNWTLFHGTDGPAGPDTVSYDLTVSNTVSGGTSLVADACRPFSVGAASGHPWSDDTHDASQTAPFVDSCTLTRNSNTSYTLTLDGIDYSKGQVPTSDSRGELLPTDRQAVAAGVVVIRVNTTDNSGQITVSSNDPTYEAVDGSTSTDDGENNTTAQAWTGGLHYGGWNGSNNWSDTLRLARGTETFVATSLSLNNVPDRGARSGSCILFDSRYAPFTGQVDTYNSLNDDSDLNLPIEYYTGGSALLDPDSPTYDPNASEVCGITAEWSSTPPADLSTVRAIRAMYDPRTLPDATRAYLRASVRINDDVAVGQDVWMFSAYANPNAGANNGDWAYPNRSTSASDAPAAATPTPGARYPFSYAGRDIARIIGVEPNVSKSVTPSIVDGGGTATYTVTYSADSAGSVEPEIDGYLLEDTLPAGAQYVAGSAAPEPSTSTDGEGDQLLTWTLDDVETNTQHELTYEVLFDEDVAGGDILTNEVEGSVDGQTSDVATASVTVNDAGSTSIVKTADQAFIPNLTGEGDGEGSWSVDVVSEDPSAQAFTDTIDILPYNGDGRGTDMAGTYQLSGPVPVSMGASVYYTTALPDTLSDDPADSANGAAGDPAGNTAGWSTTFTADATAVRVITDELEPRGAFNFTVPIVTEGMEGEDELVNLAQGRAENTRLVMRTSAPTEIAKYYSANLKKYVQNADGEWVDANEAETYPEFFVGDTVHYRIVIENTGQGTLTNLEIADDLFPDGSFTVDELAPGESESHEFSIVLGDDALDAADEAGDIVNTACAIADTPEDSQVPPTINCDPAGIDPVGDTTHTKKLTSARPIGDGQWQLDYDLTVESTERPASYYDLTDELQYTDEVDIVSAEVTSWPDGVTLAEPAWDGQGNLTIAEHADITGLDSADYAPHVYEVSVIADVPLQIVGAGSVDDPTACGEAGDDVSDGRAFTNTSGLTKASGETEDGRACAPIPSIDITKSITSGPTPNGDGTWSLGYDVVVTNDGAGDGVYDVSDRMTAAGDLIVVDSSIATTPGGVVASDHWTGLGEEGAEENIIATEIDLAAGAAHTYRIEATFGMAEGIDGDPDVSACAADGSGDDGGLANTAEVAHNDLTDVDDACASVAAITIDKTISDGPTPNGDGTFTIIYDLVAENIGGAAGDYDLADQLHYGDGIEIVEAGVQTAPDGVETNGGWTGLGEAGSDENVVAAAVTLAEGETHTYRIGVTVQLDEDSIDPSVLACPEPGSGESGGLANATELNHNGILDDDDVCASLPLVDIDKTISDGPTPNGDGSWSITYDLVASNSGEGAGDYDLADQLRYGDGVIIDAAQVTSLDGIETNAGWTGQGDAYGDPENVIVEGARLDAGASHTYRVQTTVSLDRDVVTGETLACPAPDSGDNGGLANSTELTHNGENRDDEACAPLPLIDITKSVSGAVEPVDGENGVYDVGYELRVTNAGAGDGTYDLTDELAVGEGIEVVGVQSVTTEVDGAELNPEFDGLSDPTIVSRQHIDGAGASPTEHVYHVTVRYFADLGDVAVPTDDTCSTDDGPASGALDNEAHVIWNSLDEEDDACIRTGRPTLDKELVSADPVGDGQWRVVYDLTVGNVGDEATTYDLDDELLFAPDVTVDGVEVEGPAGVDLNDGFDGAADQRVASDVGIAGLDDDGYRPHVYTVTVLAGVPLHIVEAETDGTGAPGCTAPAGGNLIEQGLNNAATLTDDVGNEQVDTDCAPLPSLTIEKEVSGEPTVDSDGEWTIAYEIVVANDGAMEGQHDLTDELRFGAGIDVVSAEVTGAPDGVEPSATWDGEGDTVIASDVALAVGASHEYAVTVTALLDESATDASTFGCEADDADGTAGFRNVAGVGRNDLVADDDACAAPEEPENDLAVTGVAVGGTIGLALLLLLSGAMLMTMRRRRGARA